MSEPKITPFLWFNNNLSEALEFYTAIFPASTIKNISRAPDGKVHHATFSLEGQSFIALDGGPSFTFTEAISLFIRCKDQVEVDYYWNRLLEDGGKPIKCGWLKDRFGLVWQVIPEILGTYLSDQELERRERVQSAMVKMDKIVVSELNRAYKGDT